MIEGLEQIRSAAETLATRDERLKARLKKAGREFWSAMYHVDEWPAELQKLAESVQRSILAHGSVRDTVSRMSRSEARQAAGEILDLLVEFEKITARRETGAETVETD